MEQPEEMVPKSILHFSNLVHDPMLLVLTYDGISGKRQALLNGTVVINQSNDVVFFPQTNRFQLEKNLPQIAGVVFKRYSEFIVLEKRSFHQSAFGIGGLLVPQMGSA